MRIESRHIIKHPRDDVLGLGKERVVVRVVAAPHHLLDADPLAQSDADLVVLEGDVALAAKYSDGVSGSFCAGMTDGAMHGEVEPLKEVRHPAGIELGGDDLQRWMPLQHAAGDQRGQRHRAGGVGQRVVQHRIPLGGQPHLHAVRAGEDVEGNRHTRICRRGPETVVGRVVIGPLAGPVHQITAPRRPSGGPFQLAHAVVDVAQRNRGGADQPLGRVAPVSRQPVVIALCHQQRQLGILHGAGQHADTGVDDLGSTPSIAWSLSRAAGLSTPGRMPSYPFAISRSVSGSLASWPAMPKRPIGIRLLPTTMYGPCLPSGSGRIRGAPRRIARQSVVHVRRLNDVRVGRDERQPGHRIALQCACWQIVSSQRGSRPARWEYTRVPSRTACQQLQPVDPPGRTIDGAFDRLLAPAPVLPYCDACLSAGLPHASYPSRKLNDADTQMPVLLLLPHATFALAAPRMWSMPSRPG